MVRAGLSDRSQPSVKVVEAHCSAGQDAVLSRRRGAFEAFAHHFWRAGEEPIRVRIVGRPHDLVRADEVREYLEAGFDRLERNPAVSLEEFARPRLQARIVAMLVAGISGRMASTIF